MASQEGRSLWRGNIGIIMVIPGIWSFGARTVGGCVLIIKEPEVRAEKPNSLKKQQRNS